MTGTIDPASPLLFALLWSSDPATQTAIAIVLGAGLLAGLFVYLPLGVRLLRIGRLERAVARACRTDERTTTVRRDEIATAFADSPLARQWDGFEARWRRAANDGAEERAPVRLVDALEDEPLLPPGIRRSLLPALPGLFLAAGVLGTFLGLTLAISGGSLADLAAESGDPATRAGTVALLVGQIGLALRAALWGILLAIGAALASRLLEGRAEALSTSLDAWVEQVFGSLSTGELANLAVRVQRQSLAQLGSELTRFTNDLSERLDRGMQRIESSTANAANLVSEEQRRTLHTVVRELSVQVQQGVEEHLAALHIALERTVEHPGAVTGGLAATFERMAEEADVHSRVSETLERTAHSVEVAAEAISTAAHDMTPVLDRLRETGVALQQTSSRMESTHVLVSRSAESVRGSLEHSASALAEQRDFIEHSLGEIRSTLARLSSGLGEDLSQALRSVDDALSQTVGRLRETIVESNDTIDRMAVPLRAAEGTTLEMQTALERVRSEVTGLGEWLAQAIKPVRHTLDQLEERSSEITRALVDFGSHTHAVDKTMDALRAELREEGRHFRTATSDLGRRLQRASEAIEALSSRRVRQKPGTADAPDREAEPAVDPDPNGGSPALSQLALGQAGTLSEAIRNGGGAGRNLGPDPYVRRGPDGRADAPDAESGAAEPAETLPQIENAHVGDEPRLSELLRCRSAEDSSDAPARPADEKAPEPAPVSGEVAEPGDSGPKAGPHPRRSWRLLGRS